MDVAGNELKTAPSPGWRTASSPGVTVDALLSAQLLTKDAESRRSRSARTRTWRPTPPRWLPNENCTCLSIAGGGGSGMAANERPRDVNLPTPSNGTYTFNAVGFSTTGIYGVLVQGQRQSGPR